MDTAVKQPGSLMLATNALWHREMVRFFRQRNRVVGAFATPLVFWLLLGSGMHGSFSIPGGAPGSVDEGVSYLEYFFPGTVVLILMFTAIFSTISVIEDRREGFLQAVLVAPAPRLAIVMGKVLGGATIATIQGAVFLVIWPLVGSWPGMGAMAMAVVVMFVLSVQLTALGLLLAWPMDSTAGFHAVMNLLLMPMWFLCGAVFPVSSAPVWMQWVMRINPLTYGQAAFSDAMLGRPVDVIDGTLTVAFTVIAVALAVRCVTRPRKESRG